MRFRKSLDFRRISVAWTNTRSLLLKQNYAVAFFVLLVCANVSQAAQTITATWRGQSLEVVLERLANSRQTTIWLDRRVDPQQPVTLELAQVSFAQALSSVAEHQSLRATQVGGIYYVGPEKTARGLAALGSRARDALANAPSDQKQRWLNAESWSWPRLSRPRALLRESLTQAGIELRDAELVPHDLWAERQLPPLPLVDRVVLLLAGFDLTCDISADGSTCRVRVIDFPLPEQGTLLEDRPPTTTGTSHAKQPALERQRFSLRLKNQPVQPVLRQLAAQLQLRLTWDDALEESARKTLISCQVEEATLDELLWAILSPAGLEFARTGNEVRISTATAK